MDDDNRYIEQRREKLGQLRHQGQAYPNHFQRRDLAGDLRARYEASSKQELEDLALQVQLAGRMMLQRDKGKVVFADLQDMSGRIQIFVRGDAVGADAFEAFKHGDIGDIFGVSGQ
ncbi:MAG: lysine--tRNA ligase, partial [Gammaproteobacteria bacterium]|nr:lysine--tRNA ligase [Gammaproteobacteria bacterium]